MTNNWQRWKGIMKCVPFEELRLKRWLPPYIVQPKYDGVRCRAIPLENGYLLVSSEENPIWSVPSVLETLDIMFPVGSRNRPELDGELYRHGLSFEDIISITSRTKNQHCEHRSIEFHCFDIINSDLQAQRITDLMKIPTNHHFKVSPYWIADTFDSVTEIFDKVIELGYEGIIVRHMYNIYERRRSTKVMKFKPKKEDDYVISGVQEEIDKEGLPKGSLGALTCLSGDGHLFNVGTGFTQEQRQVLWDDREQLPGKVVKIKYQHITVGRKVPRFPVFVEIS